MDTKLLKEEAHLEKILIEEGFTKERLECLYEIFVKITTGENHKNI